MQAVRDIQSFAEQNPSIKIIVSSRTNFYNKTSGEEEGSTLRDFSPYLLESLTQEDYKKYITENFTFDYDCFYKEVTQNRLLPLLENPFFLIAGDRRLSAPALFNYDQGVSLATVLPAILPNTQASELFVAP